MSVEVTDSARKHGVDEEDIQHAWRNVITFAEEEYDGETRLLAVGPARDSNLLELVLVPALAPTRVIHAMHARTVILKAVGLA